MLETDDDIYRVDDRYLGPPGRTLPWQARYRAYALGIGVFVTVLVLARSVLHIPMSFKLLIILLALTVVVTVRVMRKVTPERPMRSILRAAANDLRSPRALKPGEPIPTSFAPTARRIGRFDEHH